MVLRGVERTEKKKKEGRKEGWKKEDRKGEKDERLSAHIQSHGGCASCLSFFSVSLLSLCVRPLLHSSPLLRRENDRERIK